MRQGARRLPWPLVAALVSGCAAAAIVPAGDGGGGDDGAASMDDAVAAGADLTAATTDDAGDDAAPWEDASAPDFTMTAPPDFTMAAPPDFTSAMTPPDLTATKPPTDLTMKPPADLAVPPPPDLKAPPDLKPPPPDLATAPDLKPPPDPCGGLPDMKRLYNYIEAAVKQYGFCPDADWAVTDFNGNRAEVPGSTNPHESASTIKLFVMVAVLDDVEHGKYPLSATLPCAGATRTVDACLGLMIGVSDNCATYAMVHKTGIAHVNAIMHGALAMATSTFHHWCFSCPDYPGACSPTNTDGIPNTNNTINAHDVIGALERLHTGTILPTLTQKAYDYLKTAHGWTPMLARFPPIPVGHKQGWLPASQGYNPLVENDAGIGFACRPYGATILIEHSWKNVAEDQAALDLGAHIGRLAYCTFHPAGTATDGVSCASTWSMPPGPPCK